MAMKPKRFYTITEAAKELGLTRSAVHEAIKTGRLDADWGKVVQVAEAWRIPSKAVRSFRVSSLHQEIAKKSP